MFPTHADAERSVKYHLNGKNNSFKKKKKDKKWLGFYFQGQRSYFKRTHFLFRHLSIGPDI